MRDPLAERNEHEHAHENEHEHEKDEGPMMRRWMLGACVLALPAAAQAQGLEDYDYEDLSFRGIGLDFGYIWPTKVESAPAYGVRVDLGFLGPGVRVVPSIGYWSSEMKSEELARLATQLNRLDGGIDVTAEELGEIEWSDLAVSLDGQYVWEVGRRVYPFLGAGAGVHLFNGSGDAISGTFVEDLLDSVTAGLAVLAGIEVEPVERLRIYAEARYTLLDDIRYPGVKIGGAFSFPSRREPAARVGGGGR